MKQVLIFGHNNRQLFVQLCFEVEVVLNEESDLHGIQWV